MSSTFVFNMGVSLGCFNFTELLDCIVNATDVIQARAVSQMWNSRDLRAVTY